VSTGKGYGVLDCRNTIFIMLLYPFNADKFGKLRQFSHRKI
jgi:hypothetical protein